MLLFCVSVLGAGRIYHPGGDCNVTVLCFSTRCWSAVCSRQMLLCYCSVFQYSVLVGCIILAKIVMLLFCVSVLGAGRLYHPGRDCNGSVLCFSTWCWSDVSSWWRL